jgi:hypothetical protein
MKIIGNVWITPIIGNELLENVSNNFMFLSKFIRGIKG